MNFIKNHNINKIMQKDHKKQILIYKNLINILNKIIKQYKKNIYKEDMNSISQNPKKIITGQQ